MEWGGKQFQVVCLTISSYEAKLLTLSRIQRKKEKIQKKICQLGPFPKGRFSIHVYQHLYNFLVLVSSVIYVVSRVVYLPYRMPHRTTITTPQHYCFLFLSRKPKSEVSLGSIQIIIIIIIIKITK